MTHPQRRSRRGWAFIRWLDLSDEQPTSRPIRIDAKTTPARLTRRVIGGARRFTLPATALAITHQIGEALVPILVGVVIERALATGDPAQLALWLAVLAADFALLSYSWRFGSRLAELGTLVVQHRLRLLVSEHLLLRTAGEKRVSDRPGVALSLATADVARLAGAVEIGVYPVGQLAAVVFGGGVLLTVSWQLGLVVLLGAPILLGAAELAGRDLQRSSIDEQASAATAAGRAADLMAGYRVIRGIGDRAAREAVTRYRATSRHALTSTLRARRADGVFGGGMTMVAALLLAGVAIAATALALAGELSVGALVTAVGLTQFLIEPLQYAAREAGSGWATAKASASRILDLIREGGEEPMPKGEPVRRVTLPSLAPAPGELVVIVADDRHVPALLSWLRGELPGALLVPHQAQLFPGTVLENIRLPGTRHRDVERAIVTAACDEFAAQLPDGLNTQVGEAGSALSGGQRQRIALARALATGSETLVLHDPTTAVDAVTEAAIASRLRASRAGSRTLVISRSAAFAAVADRVVRFAVAGPSERTAVTTGTSIDGSEGDR